MPSPSATAATLQPMAAPAPATNHTQAVAVNPARERDGIEAAPFWKRGWFWGVTGGVVIAAVLTDVLVSIRPDPERAAADERIMTLRSR